MAVVPSTSSASGQPASLADSALPRRARQLLERLLEDVRTGVGQRLPQILQSTELALAQAPPGNDPKLETARLSSIRNLGGGVQAFTRRFLAHLETSLAGLRTPPRQHDPAAPEEPILTLALLDEEQESDQAVLDNLASRLESRNSLALQLLGHRFGVLAGAPAFDGQALPLGPHAFCNALADAADSLALSRYARMQLFQQFERAMVDFYPPLLDIFNRKLAEDGILPHLSFIPMRVRPATGAETASDADGTSPEGAKPTGPAPWPAAGQPANPDFAALQGLLQRRRALLAKLRPGKPGEERARQTLHHDEVLGALQRMRDNATKADSLADYRQILLAQARQQHGRGVALSDTDGDSFELLAQLLGQLQRDLRKSSPGRALVERLALPLLQLVLRDQRFFTDAAHPARQLLAAISLAGAHWLDDDDLDSQWLGLLQRAVSSIQQDNTGALETFADANQTLQSGLQALARKATMAERRQIEAARGREKLEQARLRASEELSRLLEGRHLSRFHQTLLEQAWADVLSLTYLRNGEDSEIWRELLETGARIIDANAAESGEPTDPAFLERIRTALEQVGYHSDDARALALQFANGRSEDDDVSSRTELLLQLRARARLGEGNTVVSADTLPPRTPEEEAAYERLRALDGPVWVEFRDDPEHPRRRRLVWVGSRSGQALMVNRRGMRAGNDDLDTLARKLAAGQACLLENDTAPAEAAWANTVGNLRQIAGKREPGEQEPGHGH